MLKLLAFFLLRLAGTVHCLGSANPDSGFSIPNSPSKRTSNFIQNDTLLETASDTEVQSSPCACGVRNQRQLRIIGGIGHAPNEFPFSALLVKLNADGTLGWNPFCGGSIVTNKHILTAAHCFDKRYYLSLLKVALGAHGWKQNDFGDKLHGVDKVIVHEKYASTSSMYDIALLVLSNTLTFNENIVPVCLPSPSLDVMGQTVKVIGYGAQSFPGGMVALPAQFDTIVVPEAHCASRSKTPVPGSTLCTWSTNGAPCKGDSGGPVVWLDPHTNTYTLVGIVSHGWSCNVMQHPSVQTLVTHYLPWIFNHLDGVLVLRYYGDDVLRPFAAVALAPTFHIFHGNATLWRTHKEDIEKASAATSASAAVVADFALWLKSTKINTTQQLVEKSPSKQKTSKQTHKKYKLLCREWRQFVGKELKFGILIVFILEKSEKMLETTNDQLAMLMASGEYDRFKNLLRNRLRECGWVDEVYMMCRQTERSSNMSVNELYGEVAKKSRALVPASVKRELLVRVKESLLQSNGYYDDNTPAN